MPPIIRKGNGPLQPYWTTADGLAVKLYQGDVLDVLNRLPRRSVHCAITSPPYWGLRDYGTGEWEGGRKDCDHVERYKEQAHKSSTLGPTAEQRCKGDFSREHPADNAAFKAAVRQFASQCGKCGARRIDSQLGSESVPDCLGWARGVNCADNDNGGNWQTGCHACRMVLVFRSVRRILRDDGTLWLNYGDTYSASSYGESRTKETVSDAVIGKDGVFQRRVGRQCNDGNFHVAANTGLKSGNLVGIPWRVAFALQADGWILRSDIPWLKRCLSGGAIVYARTQKGDMPVMVKDLVRLRPETVQLWNGERWTQVRGFCETKPSQGPRSRQLASIMRRSGRANAGLCGPADVEIEFRSGERVACTRIHQWPTQRGVIQAKDLKVGDCVPTVRLPEPENPLSPSLLDDREIGWVVGFYIAEGCTPNEREVKFSLHANETAEFERIKAVAESLGDSCTFKRRGQTSGATISVSGKLFAALMAEYVYGKNCYTKGLTTKAWQRSDRFLVGVAKGYLDGDGHNPPDSDQWKLGFCNNDRLASDLRTLASRTNSRIRLRRCSHRLNDQLFPGWKGEWRFWTSCTDTTQGEIVAIRNARSRKFWDIEVADEPHTFALASGILTHNSAMPESTNNRPCKALEYVFLFAKQGGYYFDMEAVRKKATEGTDLGILRSKIDDASGMVSGAKTKTVKDRVERGVDSRNGNPSGKRAFRNADLWFESVKSPHGLTGVGDELVGIDCTSEAYPGAHYATFPSKLITPFILAGTSEYGCCANCGTPWRRVVSTEHKFQSGISPNEKAHDRLQGNNYATRQGRASRIDTTIGWEQACGCDTEEVVPCTVLDPFIGSGTTAAVALEHGRYAIGIELKEEYLRKDAIPRIEGVCFASPELRHLVKREVKRVNLKGKRS